ncbi:cupin domain-containing protein [Fulvimarina pelagi]|nr:cupin domain-containing protein [Fulvimarina pelagi]
MVEVSASEVHTWLGTTYRSILAPMASSGAMSIVDSVSPAGSGPPRHIHHTEDETFVVLTGRVKFWLEGEEFVKGPGETAFISRGKEHTFKIVGEEPSRHLLILTPGGFEEFFFEMAAGQFAIPSDTPAIQASAERHNMTLTGPPLD